MAVDEEVVILIICIGAFKGVSYGIQVSGTHQPTIIQIPTDSLKLKTNFLPGRKERIQTSAKSNINHTDHAITYFGRSSTTLFCRLIPK